MKKVFFVLLAMAMMALANSHSVHAAYTPMAGDLIKTPSFSAIYVVDDNLKRHLFPNEVTFWTWHSGGWSNQKIKTITQDEFDELAVGKNVLARPGANLIMFDNSNKTYAVTPGGVLCETRALYGDNWQSRVIRIQSSFETDYVKDSSCTVISSGKLPDGSLIQYKGSKDVYYIEAGKKRKVTADGFTLNNFKDYSIIRDVPTTMTYTANSKTISNYEYNLGVLYSFTYTRAEEVSARPDFVVSDIVFPTNRIITNQTADIKLIIRNLGGDAVSDKGLRNIIFSGTDWVSQNVARPDYPSAVNPLTTGKSFEITYTGKFIASGSKEFTARVDEPSEVLETNEKNNAYSEKITVYSN